MSASHEMLEAWRVASKYGFKNGPIIRVPKREPLTFSVEMSRDASMVMRCWEFCQKRVLNRETGEPIAWLAHGRLHPDETEWTPLDDLPSYAFVA